MMNKRVKNARFIFAFMVPLTIIAFYLGYLTIRNFMIDPILSNITPYDYVRLI